MVDETLNVRIKGTNQAGGAVGQFRGQMNSLVTGMRAVNAAIAGAFAVATVDRFARAVRGVISETSTLGKVADRAGIATGEIQRLRFGFELLDVASDKTDKALQKFAINISEAARGTGELAPIVKANNVELRDADGRLRSQSDLLRVFANLIRDAGSAQDRTNIAYKAFGRAGADLVLGLKDGETGLRSLLKEADRTGGVIEDRVVRRMEEVDDKIARLSRTISFNFKSAIAGAVDQLDQFGSSFEGLAQRIGNASIFDRINDFFGTDPAEGDAIVARIREANGLPPLPGLSSGGPRTRGGRRRRAATVVPQTGGSGGGTRDDAARAAEAQAAKIKTVVDQLKFEAEQVGRTAEEQRLHNELRAAGVSLSSNQGQQIASLVGHLGQLGAANESAAISQQQLNDAAQFFGDEALDAISGLLDGTQKLDDVVLSLAKSFADAALQAALLGQGPLAGLSGGGAQGGSAGGLIGAALSAFNLPGFATGGSFRVGGSGGVDSQLVAFRASPDETVAISRPGQAGGTSAGGGLTQNLTFNSGITPPDMARIRTEIARAQIETRRLVQKDIQQLQGGRSDAVLQR
jgi:hypothetical protein